MKQHHAETALADTATDGERQAVVEQLLMEVELLAGFLTLNLQLAQQALLVHTDAHRRKFERASQYGIPDQDVTVQALTPILGHRRPVVIVRCAAVVLLSVGEFAADADDEDGTIGLTDGILALLRCLVGIHTQQFLGMDEVNLLRQEGLNLGIGLAHQILRPADGCVDALHDILQEGQRAVFPADDGLPVPLVYIERVQIVQFLVGTDGIHVGIDAIAALYLILGQRQSLPLGQRVNHLGTGIAQILDGEGDSTLHAIQIVVDAQPLQHKEGGRHTTQTQFSAEVSLKKLFYQFDTLLRLTHVEQALIAYRLNNLAHNGCL